MKKPITPEQIAKQVDFLSAIQKYINANNGAIPYRVLSALAREHKTSNTFFYSAVDAGVFVKIGASTYKSHVDRIEPFMVRKAIISHRRYHRLLARKMNRGLHQTPSPKTIKNVPAKPSEGKQLTFAIPPLKKPSANGHSANGHKKQVSILWGLVKFSY